MSSLETQLVDELAAFTHDPLGHTVYAFDWGYGELADHPGPRTWQADILAEIGAHLQNPATRHSPLCIAVSSGHGIGKSALIGMVCNWAMDTCEDCKVVVTANTENQLRTKTWPEISSWFRRSIAESWFKVEATSIVSAEKLHAKSWRADAVPWSERNTEAFAGLHNVGKRIVMIFDEASAIHDKVWEVAKGALTDENTEIIWIAFGNPTQASGAFRDCFGRNKHRWVRRQIDSRTVEGTNKAYLQQLVDDYGEDSDIVKVRVRGMFPSASFKQFISTVDVDAAFGRHLNEGQYGFAPKILTLDNAWEGDDEAVIGLRQGLTFQVLWTAPKNDNDIFVAQKLAALEDEHQADAVFIDGGFGTGVASAGKTWGRDWSLVWFSGASPDPGCLNLRAHMWNQAKAWLKEGGSIQDDQQLHDELLGPETIPRLDGKIQLESKQDMKRRGLASPNRADALVLSFAAPVQKKDRAGDRIPVREGRPYDPYEHF